MVSANTLCKNVLNVKNTVIENFNLYSDNSDICGERVLGGGNITDFFIYFDFFHFFILSFDTSDRNMFRVSNRRLTLPSLKIYKAKIHP